VRLYYALITGVDAAVGMIREALDRQGLAENTVIILTSDNGYNSGSHGFGDKVIPYEEGSKSPLIIFDPRLPKHHVGLTCEAVTANVDMTATIFALANVPAPEGIDGKNLLPLLANTNGKVRVCVRAIYGRRIFGMEVHPLVLRWPIEAQRSSSEADRGVVSLGSGPHGDEQPRRGYWINFTTRHRTRGLRRRTRCDEGQGHPGAQL
jgi:arylsulfatase A-like enzyme